MKIECILYAVISHRRMHREHLSLPLGIDCVEGLRSLLSSLPDGFNKALKGIHKSINITAKTSSMSSIAALVLYLGEILGMNRCKSPDYEAVWKSTS